MLCGELEVVLISTSLGLDEAKYFLVAFFVDGFDEGCTSIYDTSLIGTIVVAPCFIQQGKVFSAGIHFSPAHTPDIGVHTPDTIIVVIARELGS